MVEYTNQKKSLAVVGFLVVLVGFYLLNLSTNHHKELKGSLKWSWLKDSRNIITGVIGFLLIMYGFLLILTGLMMCSKGFLDEYGLNYETCGKDKGIFGIMRGVNKFQRN